MAGSPQHATLVAATVTTLTFDDAFDRIEGLTVSGTDPIYFRLDGIDPTVAGTGCHVIPGVAGAAVEIPVPRPGYAVVVKAISAGTPKVSFRGLGHS